jgi:aminoglycoside phosphotransferase (APT) family kinase protein
VSTLDVAALQAWFDATLPGPATPLAAQRMCGGASNLIFRLQRGERSYALRMPAPSRNDASANTMLRELRLMRALAASDVRHARLVACCEDEAVIGAPFAVLDWIDGFVPRQPLAPSLRSREAKRRLAEEVIDGLASVSNADWRRLGLDGFGKPEAFLQRQVDRWASQLQRASSRKLEHVDEICSWLRTHTPVTQRAGLIHGDYTYVNVMFAHGAQPRLIAIVDWELATIGDPLLDLGWLLACWQEAGELPSHAVYFDWSDMPSRVAMAERYARATGLDIAALPFYLTLATFKFAVIMEGWYAAYVAGRSSHPVHATMQTGVPHILARAAMFAGLN